MFFYYLPAALLETLALPAMVDPTAFNPHEAAVSASVLNSPLSGSQVQNRLL